jgi:SAM-dependent methyltransferase
VPPRCRFCRAPLHRTLVDLGEMPLANAYPATLEEAQSERRYPLHARVCGLCWLVQVDEVVSREELFSDYAYFSSFSASWVEHARRFAAMSVERWNLDGASLVVEVASNDGYLLRHFQAAGAPVLGVDPAANVAQEAIAAGVPTEVAFFGVATATQMVRRGRRASLLIANNVLAHVPDINDFAAGIGILLAPTGIVSIEFPHLLQLIERAEFDTIYHEHYSYLSLLAAERILDAHGLSVFDVEELTTHGGSLRIWAAHRDVPRPVSERLVDVRRKESQAGMAGPDLYRGFGLRVENCRRSVLAFLAAAAAAGDTVVAYGAAAKGNTLLNHCQVTTADIGYVVDRSSHKQGRFLPGSHLPIRSPDAVFETRPRYLMILPWNLRDEICAQMAAIRAWGGEFVIPVPEIQTIP